MPVSGGDILARRQPGSAFKPFVYAAAIAARGGGGFTAATFLEDTPLTLTIDGKPWTPRNYEDRYLGRVTVRQALEQSLNAATIRLAQDVGFEAIVERARQVPGREQEVWDYYRKTPAAAASLRAPIFEEKVVDFLLELATIAEKQVSREELLKDDEDDKPATG